MTSDRLNSVASATLVKPLYWRSWDEAWALLRFLSLGNHRLLNFVIMHLYRLDLEDSIYRELLAAISQGRCSDPAYCCGMALLSQSISFPRWCA